MKKAMIVAVVSTLLLGQATWSVASRAPRPTSGTAPSAPPRECDIRLPVWCILQGVDRIILVNEVESGYNDFWELQGAFEPKSELVILEPPGCRIGLSDTLKSLGFDTGIYWHSKIWDRIIVKLKKDGSCNLALLFPPYRNDPMEWAFSNGVISIRACQDKSCGDKNPTTGEMQDLYWEKFKAVGASSGTSGSDK